MPKSPSPALREFLERFGDLLSRIVLGLIYFVFVTPVGLILSLAKDPLGTRRWRGSSFTPWKQKNDSLERARRQIS